MSTSALPWRKRSFELDSHIPNKKSCYYYRLESEGSAASTDGTESVYSVQGRETDVVRDTTDTASDTTEYDVDIEYEIESLSDDDGRDMIIFDSSGESDDIIYATAVVGDSSLETFITDAEDSDNSRQDDSSSGLRDFWICIQCKSQNDNPQYRFCDKCFQDRKAIFPPRPRRRKKAEKTEEKSDSPVKLDALKSCLNGLSSQDSGISSGQEFGSLCLDQIVVPSSTKSSSSGSENRKRQISESSLSDEYEEKPPRKHAKKSDKETISDQEKKEEKSDKESDSVRTKDDQIKGPLPELKEDCIMCNVKPKNSVFLHGRIAHMCCCYGCAMRTWKSLKRCPICQRKVSNVVRVFTT